MFSYVWEYHVHPAHLEAFLEHYRPCGTWTTLFSRGAGYVGTQLVQDRVDATRFLTIDTWSSAEAHAAFRRQFEAEFEQLDATCAAFTRSERHVGDFDVR